MQYSDISESGYTGITCDVCTAPILHWRALNTLMSILYSKYCSTNIHVTDASIKH